MKSTILILFPKICNPYIKNRPVAVSATRREQVMIIRFAVRMTFPLEEVPCTQLLVAVSTCEVFWMPRLAQCRYYLRSKNIIKSRRISNHWTSHWLKDYDEVDSYLAHDRFFAGAAASFLGCVDTLAAHVGLKIAEHRIQLILFQRLALSWMIEVGRVSLGDVNAGLRTLVGQRALWALGGFVWLRVWRVGHRLMLMSTAIDLQRYVYRRIERVGSNAWQLFLSEKLRLNPKCGTLWSRSWGWEIRQ